jgi:hypothetical protein
VKVEGKRTSSIHPKSSNNSSNKVFKYLSENSSFLTENAVHFGWSL